MKNEVRTITVGGIEIDVVRKTMKSIRLGVYPPGGNVRMAVPRWMTDDAVRTAIAAKISWIQRHREKISSRKHENRKEFVTGESHYYQGKRFELVATEYRGRSKLLIRDGLYIQLFMKPDSTRSQRERMFLEWYRKDLKLAIPPLIRKWEKIIGVVVDEWGVKRMRTRWGTCNRRAKKIWLNLEAVKKPIECLEYIIVHEMVHLLEKRHNARFKAYMSEFLPEWRSLCEELNGLPMRGSSDEL